jgi:GT2 family glycosyltransferase
MATQYEHLEIVVADNGSNDDSLEVLKNEFPQVTLITHKPMRVLLEDTIGL